MILQPIQHGLATKPRRITVVGKSRRTSSKKEDRALHAVPSTQQRVLPMLEVLVNAEGALHELVVETGMQVLEALLEQDRVALCGPKSQPSKDRQAYRHGFDQGQLVLGGRKVQVRKPRCRSVEGEELTLPTWREMASEDPLRRRMVEQMLIGVSTRKYERSLAELPDSMKSVASKKSSVSRRFVSKPQRQVEQFLGRSLKGDRYPVLMIDGTELGGQTLIVVLGVDADGQKRVLGARQGTTESSEVIKSLMRELIDRGLDTEEQRLVVLDGSRGLHKAVGQVFGAKAQVQRCQIHKMRNVKEHLPESHWPWVREQLRQAWLHSDSAEKAERLPTCLAKSLEEEYPSASRSIQEGLSETLTLLRLGLSGDEPLYKSLRSTKPVEGLQERIKSTSPRVKRWRSGSMALRWAVSGMMEAEEKF
ncbi:MAG: IS256 family transposase, partial [Acidobacteriota bacterium]